MQPSVEITTMNEADALNLSQLATWLESLGSEKAARHAGIVRDAQAEIDRLRDACHRAEHEVQQILGKALGYPRYADDPKEFPGATDADGVCVGDQVAASLADQAVAEIDRLRAVLESIANHSVCCDARHEAAAALKGGRS